jgi:hypothetical protein
VGCRAAHLHCSHSAGIRVHVNPESVLTMSRNTQLTQQPLRSGRPVVLPQSIFAGDQALAAPSRLPELLAGWQNAVTVVLTYNSDAGTDWSPLSVF